MSKGLYGALDKSLDSACRGFAFIFIQYNKRDDKRDGFI